MRFLPRRFLCFLVFLVHSAFTPFTARATTDCSLMKGKIQYPIWLLPVLFPATFCSRTAVTRKPPGSSTERKQRNVCPLWGFYAGFRTGRQTVARCMLKHNPACLPIGRIIASRVYRYPFFHPALPMSRARSRCRVRSSMQFGTFMFEPISMS